MRCAGSSGSQAAMADAIPIIRPIHFITDIPRLGSAHSVLLTSEDVEAIVNAPRTSERTPLMDVSGPFNIDVWFLLSLVEERLAAR